jgi:hypothetical protein
MIRENGRWDCFNMIVLKDFPCASKFEACLEEDKIMRKMKASMNKNLACTTPEQISEKRKEHYQANRKRICEQRKEYQQAIENTFVNIRKSIIKQTKNS